MEEVLTEVKVINAVLKNQEKNILFEPFIDDLFTSHKDIWDYIKEYNHQYGEMPSFETIESRFEGEVEDVKTPGATMHYVDTLRSEYITNRVENLITRAAKEATAGTPSIEIKNKVQAGLAKLDRFVSTSKDLDVMDMENAESRYDEVRKRTLEMNGTPGVPTGLNFIDACMPLGMQAGDIVSVIGYPARGKSALGALWAAKIIQKGFHPLIFSMEMSAEAVQDRIFTIMASGTFSNTGLMLGDVNKDDFREFARTNTGKAHIVDGNGVGQMTPNFIRGKIEQYRPDVVFLDYLQLFSDNRLSDDMTTRMRNLSLEIKNLANVCQLPFVVISSATPPDGGKIDGPPNVERSAWSRQLSYDSTACIAIHRADDSNIYQIEGAKNRYGPLPSGFLEWDMDRGVYKEIFELEES